MRSPKELLPDLLFLHNKKAEQGTYTFILGVSFLSEALVLALIIAFITNFNSEI
jgi:hypothetical protein